MSTNKTALWRKRLGLGALAVAALALVGCVDSMSVRYQKYVDVLQKLDPKAQPADPTSVVLIATNDGQSFPTKLGAEELKKFEPIKVQTLAGGLCTPVKPEWGQDKFSKNFGKELKTFPEFLAIVQVYCPDQEKNFG